MRRLSTALATTVLAALGAAALPASAAATLSPTLAVVAGSGSTAGGTGSLGVAIAFNPTSGDAVDDFSIRLPPGVLINEETDAGACLDATGPAGPCQIGSGSATIAGVATPMTLFLVKAPVATDAAGVELVAGSLSLVGDLTYRSAAGIEPFPYIGTEIAFSGLPASSVDSLSFTLTGLSLPSSCVKSAASLSASSQLFKGLVVHAAAPYEVGGCLALGYKATPSETTTRDHGSTAGAVVFNVAFAPGDSATSSLGVQLAPNVTMNRAMDSACFNGTPCTVGTLTATSPVFPASQLTGTMTLSGTETDQRLSLALGPPLDLLVATGGFNALGVSFSSLPDIPLNTLTLNFTGNAAGRLYSILCYQAPFQATFSPWSGLPGFSVKQPVILAGCGSAKKPRPKQARPKASVSLSGIGAGAPRLRLTVSKGAGAPAIASLTVRLPGGLRFASRALSKHSVSVRGAKLGALRVRHGVLDVAFRRPAARGSLSLPSSLLVESAELRHEVRTNRVRTRRVTIGVTDGRGRGTTLSVSVTLG